MLGDNFVCKGLKPPYRTLPFIVRIFYSISEAIALANHCEVKKEGCWRFSLSFLFFQLQRGSSEGQNQEAFTKKLQSKRKLIRNLHSIK